MGSKETSKGRLYKLNLVVFYLLVICAGASHATEEERPALRDRPSLSIVVHQVQHSVTAPFDIDVILTNLTNKAFDVTKVKALLPEDVKALRPRINETLADKRHQLAAGSEHIYRMNVSTVRKPLYTSIVDFRTLLFVPGKYVVRAVVEFEPIGQTGSMQSMQEIYELTLDPPLSAPLRGGVLGALLLALFVPAYGALRDKDKPQKPKFKDLLIKGVTYLVAGSVVAVTAILLLHRVGNLDLPITIVVNDYLGGVVIGLFSCKIGDALHRQFFS